MGSDTETRIRDLLIQARDAAGRGDLDGAAALLEQVIQERPNELKALDLLGFARFFQGRFEECEELNRRSLAIKPNHPYAHSGLGMALARQGELEQGIEHLERAISLAPEWAEPYWDLAVILNEVHLHFRARDVLQRGIVAIPKQKARFEGLLKKITSGNCNEH